MRLEHDIGAWRLEGTGKGVAMAGAAVAIRRRSARPRASVPLRWDALALALRARGARWSRSHLGAAGRSESFKATILYSDGALVTI